MRKVSIVKKSALLLTLLILMTACRRQDASHDATMSLDSAGIARHISVLASDDFMGRKPFTPGETKTIEYLRDQFQSMGLKAGNGDSYFQDVPLVEITHRPFAAATITLDGRSSRLRYWDDIAVRTQQVKNEIIVKNSELVFAGYGIVAPEYGWNDYVGLDVKGKTVVVLVNDPGFATKDSTLFKGNTMTYYGRWTYKYEEAARQGAAACLIIHESAAAGYPWSVVQNGWSGAKLFLKSSDGNASTCPVEGWITQAAAQNLFKSEGVDYAKAVESATGHNFKSIAFRSRFSIEWKNDLKESMSHNVMAVLPGRERPEETVIYTAHWDHFGIGNPVDGDSIYNGAVDNASGTAIVLELARAFTKLPEPPARSVMFILVTSEEQGLLGSAYYTDHPIVPLAKTVAAINIDAVQPLGKMKDVTAVGYGQSDLDELVQALAAEQGRYVLPDQQPEKGFYFRSDHFNFAKHGVPAVYVSGDHEHATRGVEWVKEQQDVYTSMRYHQPSDEFDPATWNFDGIVEDARLFFNLGYRLAQEKTFPKWKTGSEFKAIRDQMMK